MFNLYYSNHLDIQKDLLLHLIKQNPLNDPFAKEVILVQSQGMSQWLQLQIAEQQGIVANIDFSMPASFIWQCYTKVDPLIKDNFSTLDQFQQELISWRLMRLIPQHLSQVEFTGLKSYLQPEKADNDCYNQEKLFQLANKIADLFVQYLVYRLDWITLWEEEKEYRLIEQLQTTLSDKIQSEIFKQNLCNDVRWQAILWRSLIEDIRQQHSLETGQPQIKVWHRANLQQAYLKQLIEAKKNPQHSHFIQQQLPQRLFVFGISALPQVFLETFQQLGQYIDVHLFFNSPSPYYWGDIVDPSYLLKLKEKKNWFSPKQQQRLVQQQYEKTAFNELLQIGNPLLSTWGKLGRDFLYMLAEADVNEVTAYVEPKENSLLAQVKRQIYYLSADHQEQQLFLAENDHSISFHACHSAMREVEVLHDHLLHLFSQDPNLTPRDIIVMVPNIDHYTPYIQAVFSQYHTKVNDKRAIPYAISDRKLSESDLVVSAFLHLFTLAESEFSAEEILELLDIEPIRHNFGINGREIEKIRSWLELTGIRFGLDKFNPHQPPNYNSWQNGLERMLLGYAMREQQGIWQDTLAFDFSTGLQAKLAGNLYHFIQALKQWQQVLLESQTAPQWQTQILKMLNCFFAENRYSENGQASELGEIKLFIQQNVQEALEQAEQTNYQQPLPATIIHQLLSKKLDEQANSIHFLTGQVNFCTLTPMRAIPFKVVCLLGMNEQDFPRQVLPNSFDLMQYLPRKGDRSRREDDNYLFLEALLSAQERLYISYIGRSITNNATKEPAIPVNRLLDYLLDNIQSDQPEQVKSQLLTFYPMTVFSPNNFAQPYFSYAKEWLLPTENKILADFVQPLSIQEEQEHIEILLDDLINFICSPVKYFFEKQLGVSFYQEKPELETSEHFTLNSLINYQLTEQLLSNPKEWQDFTINAEHKGLLPRAGFTQLAQQQLKDEIDPLLTATEVYRSQPRSSLEIALPFKQQHSTIQLKGRLTSLFNQKQVYWRAGKVRDRDKIHCWIKYLAYVSQVAFEQKSETSELNIPEPLFIGRDKEKVIYFEFDNIAPQHAKMQLEVYLNTYLLAKKQMLLIPTYDLAQYQKLTEKEQVNEQEWLNYLSSQLQDQYSGVYWQRTLQQTQPPTAEILTQYFEQLFELMCKTTKK